MSRLDQSIPFSHSGISSGAGGRIPEGFFGGLVGRVMGRFCVKNKNGFTNGFGVVVVRVRRRVGFAGVVIKLAKGSINGVVTLPRKISMPFVFSVTLGRATSLKETLLYLPATNLHW